MPRIRTTDQSARLRLRPRVGVTDARAPYREALTSLQADEALEVETEVGETMRALKVNVSRASNEANIPVSYGETTDGTLLVWLRTEPVRRRRQS